MSIHNYTYIIIHILNNRQQRVSILCQPGQPTEHAGSFIGQLLEFPGHWELSQSTLYTPTNGILSVVYLISGREAESLQCDLTKCHRYTIYNTAILFPFAISKVFRQSRSFDYMFSIGLQSSAESRP